MASLTGFVIQGLGEGEYFMSIGHYRSEIKKKLGFDPFPGTLNIKADKNYFDLLKNKNLIRINGFEKDRKKFGGVSCYKAKIENIDGAIIIPEINKHENNIIEFIAPIRLKDGLNIKNGDKVEIQLS
jgi:riboflavin kinase, archaea type